MNWVDPTGHRCLDPGTGLPCDEVTEAQRDETPAAQQEATAVPTVDLQGVWTQEQFEVYYKAYSNVNQSGLGSCSESLECSGAVLGIVLWGIAMGYATTSSGPVPPPGVIQNADRAIINTAKLTEYALNPNHPVGGDKSKVFESALGFNLSNYQVLLDKIRDGVTRFEGVLGKVDQYGRRYTVDIPRLGANGREAIVRTGWIYRPGSEVSELTTLFVK